MTGENSLYLMLSTTHMWEMTESGFLLLFLNVCLHGASALNMLRFFKERVPLELMNQNANPSIHPFRNMEWNVGLQLIGTIVFK